MNVARQLGYLALAVPLLLVVDGSGLDRYLVDYYYSSAQHTFPWRHDALFEALTHDVLRALLDVVPVIVLTLLLLSRWQPAMVQELLPAPWQRPRVLAYLLLAMLAGPGLIGLLKNTTSHPCPWSVIDYGGSLSYGHLWQGPFWNWQSPGKCFPGGHASGGFAWLAFVPLLSGRARVGMVAAAFSLGFAMGWARMMQGAHFLSHNLWSAWVVWLSVVLTWAWLRPPFARAPAAVTPADALRAKFVSWSERQRLAISRGVALLLLGYMAVKPAASFAIPTTGLMLVMGVALTALGALGRMWCMVYISGRKTAELVVTGPYSLSRNPLYFFSLVGATGIALCARDMLLLLGIVGFFLLYYPWVIRAEARKLAEHHGAAYAAYRRVVPAFWPRLRRPQSGVLVEVHAATLQKHLADIIWFPLMASGFVLLDCVKLWL